MEVWQASVARSRLSDIIDRAVAGHPQLIQRRDGVEVVVMSRDTFDRMTPDFKDFLLGSGYDGAGEAEFDQIMSQVRSLNIYGSILAAPNAGRRLSVCSSSILTSSAICARPSETRR